MGPWTSLPDPWTLTPVKGRSELSFSEPVWARCLRFTIQPTEEKARIDLPDQLRVLEHPAGPGYRSMGGEWTDQGSEAAHEWLNPLVPGTLTPDSGDSLESATPLPFGPEQTETVLLDRDEDWWRLEIPEPGGRLDLVLTGRPTVEAVLTLRDADGEPMPVEGLRTASARILYRTHLLPGIYYAQILEPPRSMLIAWDTSGSVSAYIDQITNGVMAFAGDPVPGRDEVNLIPFSASPRLLLDEWTGERSPALQALRSYDRRRIDSSNAELTMLRVSEELKLRDGVHAILVVTDLQSPGSELNTDLWASLDGSQAKIFAVAVPTRPAFNTPRRIREMFRDWTVPGGGYLDTLTGDGRISVAFRRAAASLRRPAAYGLSASLVTGRPEPAHLSVTAPLEHLTTSRAVEVILDGSGSMRQRLDGVPRYRIARDALMDLTGKALPEGIPFALRIFGNGGAGSCRTDLTVPLGPLDPARVHRAVKGFAPVNLATTPIGTSLAAVAKELSKAQGSAVVVLLTDGEETCDEDPTAEIEHLRGLGIQIQVNIVGFALDDEALNAQFSDWASKGGGRYLDADDGDGLCAALREAIASRFQIKRGDQVVAEGTVNGPLWNCLPRGKRCQGGKGVRNLFVTILFPLTGAGDPSGEWSTPTQNVQRFS